MGLESALARIAELQSLLGALTQPQQLPANIGAGAGADSFPALLERQARVAGVQQQSLGHLPVGQRIVELARAELSRGVREQPPGSNDSPDIARYRSAVKGAVAGAPWCAYFVSYIAQQAGVPIGFRGEGMGYVPSIIAWAKQSGRFIPRSQRPQPGDLILFPQHVGIVEQVLSNGRIQTIEGNYSNAVSRVTRSASEAVGYARLG